MKKFPLRLLWVKHKISWSPSSPFRKISSYPGQLLLIGIFPLRIFHMGVTCDCKRFTYRHICTIYLTFSWHVFCHLDMIQELKTTKILKVVMSFLNYSLNAKVMWSRLSNCMIISVIWIEIVYLESPSFFGFDVYEDGGIAKKKAS